MMAKACRREHGVSMAYSKRSGMGRAPKISPRRPSRLLRKHPRATGGICMHTDPVCGMKIDEKDANFKSQNQGETYYFCSEECKERFDQNPQQYTQAA